MFFTQNNCLIQKSHYLCVKLTQYKQNRKKYRSSGRLLYHLYIVQMKRDEIIYYGRK